MTQQHDFAVEAFEAAVGPEHHPPFDQGWIEAVIAEAEPEPQPCEAVGSPINSERRPSGVLAAVEDFISQFVAFPSDAARVAVTLWAAHTHVVGSFDSTPRLALLSPEPGSGKTRVLEVLELLTPAPMHVLSASPAAIFRSIGTDPRPTLLFDEVDAIFGRNGKSEDNEDLRGLLNAGHRNGATIPRCVGPTHSVTLFPVFVAVALAGLGDLPDTLMSRSVVIRMRRRGPNETVTPFRNRIHRPLGHSVRDDLAAMMRTFAVQLEDAFPEMPDGIEDRPADVWEPLLAVADAVGGDWPERARAACLQLAGQSIGREASLGVRLLSDLRTVFGNETRLSTQTILERLYEIDEAPWADLRGQPLNARGLAYRLGQYEVNSTKVRVGDRTLQGYRAEDLWDAWARYAPAPSTGIPEQAEQPEQPSVNMVAEVPAPSAVPEHHVEAELTAPPSTRDVPSVPSVLDNGDRSDTLTGGSLDVGQ